MEEIVETEKDTTAKKISEVYFLLKFGKEEHLKNLLDTGTLYFSPIESLRNGDDHQKDSYEGATFVKGFDGGGIIEANHPTLGYLKMKFESGSYKEEYETLYGNVCSFYAITPDHFIDGNLTPVDNRMQDFGSHFVIIDMSKFMKRFREKMSELSVKGHGRLIKYYDEQTYEGKVSLFYKRKRYDYQREYRIYIDTQKSGEPLKISLGSLNDIAWIAPSNTIQQLVMTKKITQLNG